MSQRPRNIPPLALDEYVSEKKEKPDAETLEFCRLGLLNDDCLCSIFDRLSITDLRSVSQMDPYFQVLIGQRVIGKKFIDISSLPGMLRDRIFGFGTHFRKIKAETDGFEYFLDLINENCSSFADVDLELNSAQAHNSNLLRRLVPYFSNVQEFLLCSYRIRASTDIFFEALTNVVKDLKALTLEVQNSSQSQMIYFGLLLKSNPKLQMFTYRSNDDITPTMIDSLKQDCENLETFNHIHLINPYSGRLSTISDLMKNRYNYVCEITNLRSVTMTSYTQCVSDLYYPLQKLAVKNKLQTLKVYIDVHSAIELSVNEQLAHARYSFGHFTSLTTIEIEIESDKIDTHDLKLYFLCDFMSKLKCLRQVRVIGTNIKNINKILEIVPNIRVLDLAQVTMKHLPFDMWKIVHSAKQIRQNQLELGEDRPLLHLILNLRQWNEVQVYKDIDDILTTHVNTDTPF